LSILFFRSNEIAVYAFTRALEVVFYSLSKRRYIPTVENGDSLLFAFAITIVAYCLFMEPYSIKPSYARFFDKATQLDLNKMRTNYDVKNIPFW